MKYNIGDKLRVINAGYGARAADGKIGIVTNEASDGGLLDGDQHAFNIKMNSGCVYRVSTEGEYELIQQNKIKGTYSNTHIYEHLPYILHTIVKDKNGNIIEMQNTNKNNNTYKVIYNGLTTIIILSDGTKGVATCKPTDKFSVQLGHDIAIKRAKIKQLQRELENLTK